MPQNNLLLEDFIYPPFSKIKDQNLIKTSETCLEEAKKKIELSLEKTYVSFENTFFEIEKILNKVERIFSPISHLNSVQSTENLRKQHDESLKKLTDFYSWLMQYKPFYLALTKIKTQDLKQSAKIRAIDNLIKDFELSGIGKDEKTKKKITNLNKDLSLFSAAFSNNLMDATDKWTYLFPDISELKQLPKSILDLTKKRAQKEKKDGFLFNLSAPLYLAIMNYCPNKKIRKVFYKAYCTRASDLSDIKKLDNKILIEKTLKSKTKLAELLDFKNYADLSLEKKMAKTPAEVLTFLEDILEKVLPKAQKELQMIKDFAKKTDAIEEFEIFDLAYYLEKYKKEKFAFDEQKLREYFPLKKVLNGLFKILKEIFNLSAKENKKMELWDKDVICYDIFIGDEYRGKMLLDLFIKDGKRGGAWMDVCQDKMVIDKKIQDPVAYLTCNFAPSVNKDESLLTHDDVITLFHETGHVLQHILTKVNVKSVAGINGVPWDAVELPSQFLENFAKDENTIKMISEHYHTKEPIEKEVLDKIIKLKNFAIALSILRQVEFAIFDMKLHLEKEKYAKDVNLLLDEIRQKTALLPVPKYNRFANSFSHIFAGGYAAGYYSYLWAEVLSLDAFSLFKQKENILDKNLGSAFCKSILEQGGAKSVDDLFFEFAKRKSNIDAFLKEKDIT